MTDDELLTQSAGVFIKTTLVDFPGLVASSYFLKGCNLRCPYCYNRDLVLPGTENKSSTDFVTPASVLEHLFKRKNVLEGFVISGGEPLLNPVTPVLIKKAKELGYKVKLDTNGTLPLLLENLVKNRETCPDFIAMDIKTAPLRYKKDIPVTACLENADIKALLEQSVKIISALGKNNFEFRTVLIPGLTEKNDLEQIAQIIPHDSSWQFARFRNENCLDSAYNGITPFIDRDLNELIEYAKSLIPGAALR
ncbi:MAG: anaerobic ribonucleoside-triphosphate reductase activating protein [Treponema sp.]|nr:anaerobic ribonucleoside-triphosphate reductase activating protein [Treponema sp.]